MNDDVRSKQSDQGNAALLLIDMINDLEFPDGDKLLVHALPTAERIAALKTRAKNAGIPVIYVNDNFGRWRSDFRAQVEHCLSDDVKGQPIAKLLQPDLDDYFVLKPKYSAFFSTTLELLLEYLQVRQLVLTGVSANICVLFTAGDAYMRDFTLKVPADCVASNTTQENQSALEQMQRILKADIRESSTIEW